MRPLLIVFIGFLALNVFAVVFICVNHYREESERKIMKANQIVDESTIPVVQVQIAQISDVAPELPKESSEGSYLKFDDPFLAYYLLGKLDIYEIADIDKDNEYKYKEGYRSMIPNDRYCEEHRAFFVNNPEITFNERNYITDYWYDHFVRRTVLPGIGKDILPQVSQSHSKETNHKLLYDMPVDTNVYFTVNFMYNYRVIGKQFSCLSQISNHIPGHDDLYRKDFVSAALVEYSMNYRSKPSFGKFFPKTWVLKQENQCKDFFETFNGPEYPKLKQERGIVYFRKIGAGVHQGQGVFPVNDDEEKNIRNMYRNGELCGKVTDNNLMQVAIHNPLLLHGHKFDFRVFMFVASTNPFIVYYHDGYLRISLQEYDTNSKELGTFLTNTALSKPLFHFAQENGTYHGMTYEELKEQSCWFYPQLQQYLMDIGRINDSNWIDNYLRVQIKKTMVHLTRMVQHSFMKKSSVSEIYGIDLLMDDNLQVWFIEANAMPLFAGWSDETNKFFLDMLTDSFEIVYGLLKSRMKRVILYVNDLMRKNKWKVTPHGLEMPDLDLYRLHFQEITRNHFEPEFEPSPQNKFQKIVDENYYDGRRYAGLLDGEFF